MTRAIIVDEFGREVTNHTGLLKDGQRLRVSMSFMDAKHQVELRDVVTPQPVIPLVHKPGPLGSNIKPADRAAMYAKRDAAIVDAWRTPAQPQFDGTAPANNTVTKIEAPTNDVNAAYQARDRYLSEAWRNG